jgi:GT2 family glycosyltransferase
VSVVIVNWNHGRFLPDCLDALLAQDYPAFKVLVVDNGSSDGSPEWVAGRYSQAATVDLVRFPENRGFCFALNQGIERTNGAFVLSLNPDVTVRPGFLSALVGAIQQASPKGPRSVAGMAAAGMAAPKLLRADNPARLDSTGLFVDRRRRPYDRGQGQIDTGQYDHCPYVFGACGAAALYRRTMLEDVASDGEYMDESFFAYYEDADLAWRAQLRGWRCVFAAQAVATHMRGAGDMLRKRGHAPKQRHGPRLALRNRYLMTLKNDSWHHFLADSPPILAAELPRLAYAALTMPTVLLGLVDLVRTWPTAARKRRQISRRRLVDDATIRRWFVAPEQAVWNAC